MPEILFGLLCGAMVYLCGVRCDLVQTVTYSFQEHDYCTLSSVSEKNHK
jgi:hypothetical protein